MIIPLEYTISVAKNKRNKKYLTLSSDTYLIVKTQLTIDQI